ncbi:MAG: SLBB domain-containing protein [Candidatus Rokubacteria bacterium]|nr:SLBB domain-containing protein [Candidatus Rokubacteria bacterium]
MVPRPRLLRVGSLLVATLACLAFFAPASAQEYTIGPRDILKVVVWGHDDLSKDYPVDADGFVPFPLVGRVKAGGLTTKEFAGELREVLEKDYLVNPQVLVSVKEYLSKKVYVLGEAEKRGLFYLTGPTSILEVLSQAGGLSKTAGKQIVLMRNHRPTASGPPSGSVILRLDVDKIQAGDAAENIRVEDEDMILIPKGHAFFVLGEVKNAGTFPLDKQVSVLEGVTLAGGFNERAAPAGVKIIRRTGDGRQETLSLDLSGSVPRDGDFKIHDGDTVLVPKGNTFFVFGEVKKPGAYQLDKETNILEGITIAGGFTDKAAPSRTRVIRNTVKGQQVINIDMNDIIKRGQRDKAIALQENDVVVVPESFF